MKVIVRGTCELDIEIVEPLDNPASSEPTATGPAEKSGKIQVISYDEALRNVDLAQYSIAEEAVFVALISLLRHHHARTHRVPSWRVFMAVSATLDQLLHRGTVPPEDRFDTAVLATYLGLLQELGNRFDARFLETLIESVDGIIHLDDPDGEEPTGNGAGKDEQGSS